MTTIPAETTPDRAQDYGYRRARDVERFTALWNERSEWDEHCQEIRHYLLPEYGSFFESPASAVNTGEKQFADLLDMTGAMDLADAAAGLSALVSSPGRQWQRLRIAQHHAITDRGEDINENPEAREWLDRINETALSIYAASNVYQTLPQQYLEMMAFGTCGSLVLWDFDTVIRMYPMTCGQYAIAQDEREEVDTCYRKIAMTVAQVIRRFGSDRVSESIRAQWRHNPDAWVTIYHLIEPRRDRDYGRAGNRNMPWRSCWYEEANESAGPLLESGFEMFPVIVGRWFRRPGDVYGRGPGMRALSHVKALQHRAERLSEAINEQTKPPVQAPTAAKAMDRKWLAKGVWFHDSPQPIKDIYQPTLNLQHLIGDIVDVRQQVSRATHADLFRMFAGFEPGRMTAYEASVRQQEKVTLLGPAGENLYAMLRQLFRITFHNMLRAGLVPPAPPILQGREMEPEFVSALSQAQRSVNLSAIERWRDGTFLMGQAKPQAIDNIDEDRYVSMTGTMLGVPAELIRDPDEVQAERRLRAQAAAAVQQSALIEQQSKAARNLADVPAATGQSELVP